MLTMSKHTYSMSSSKERFEYGSPQDIRCGRLAFRRCVVMDASILCWTGYGIPEIMHMFGQFL